MVTNKLDTHVANTLIPSPTTAIADTGTIRHFLGEATNNAPLIPATPLHVKLSDAHLISSIGTTSINWTGLPHRLMSFMNLTHTPSFQLASFATTIALQFSTNTMSLSHATTIASFMEPAYPMDFGAYHSAPHNHRPMPSYQPTHKKTLYNGSMLLPSALAPVPLSMQLNKISLPHGRTLPPKLSIDTYILLLQL